MTIMCDRRGSCAWITLNRPQALNALDIPALKLMGEVLDEIESDEQVRCVVITGTGRAFCAGADLKAINGLPEDRKIESIEQFLHDINALMMRVECFPKPVIAAVNGLTIGGGLELLLSCDLVVAAADARLSDGHANFGLLPGAGASVRLPRKLGATRAKYLLFTGDLISASDPIFAPLINLVVPNAELHSAVERLVDSIAGKSPLALSHVKALANAAFDVSIQEALQMEQSANKRYASSDDRREGIAAFNENRKPAFVGK
jgi:enoyl-CoA hydratase/carnithine racemase